MNEKAKQSIEKINKIECDNLSYSSFGSWAEYSADCPDDDDCDCDCSSN